MKEGQEACDDEQCYELQTDYSCYKCPKASLKIIIFAIQVILAHQLYNNNVEVVLNIMFMVCTIVCIVN